MLQLFSAIACVLFAALHAFQPFSQCAATAAA
jgi:hypothetical protein